MAEPNSPDTLAAFMAQHPGPLMSRAQWSALQALDGYRVKFDAFLGELNDDERFEYVRLQRAWVSAQYALEQGIHELTLAFEQQALASLRQGLKSLTGQDIDPKVAQIHTRYLQSANRVRRGADGDVIKTASLTLWDAACINYDGLTGWSYPGRTGLADASFLDEGINANAADFITLVRRLDLGGQLKARLDQALSASAELGGRVMALAAAEFEFALIEALRTTAASRVDRACYRAVKQALVGGARWENVEEMLLFIPHGVDNLSWLPQSLGFTGQYVGPPPGDSLSIPHIVFSVSGCRGAFSFFPNRPGGSLRHHASHREACEEFHVAFQGFYRRGEVDWLYQMMSLRDCARVKQLANASVRPQGLNDVAHLLYTLAQSIPSLDKAQSIGSVRTPVQKVPVVSLSAFYIKRCRANLQELANEMPGLMPSVIEVFQALLNEILNLLLIPVPGAPTGLGRARAFGMFVALTQGLIGGGHQALQGRPGELLQAFVDLADLLISGRMHTRLAFTAQRRHQRLYQQLSRSHTVIDPQRPTGPQLLERMLGAKDVPSRALDAVLDSSATSHAALNQVWEGAPPSASLVEAVQRFNTDRLIDWVSQGANPDHPAPVGAVEVMAPLLTQLADWPANTALSIANQQGLELRRYSANTMGPPTETVTVIALENYQFAYGPTNRRVVHLPNAIAALMPTVFAAGAPLIRQQLAALAKTLSIELFEALTRFAGASRSTAKAASRGVRQLLPDRVGHELSMPAVVAQLQALHPQVSLARLLEVLREHPLSAHQQMQLLTSQLQPEALYDALRAARRGARREAIVDGLFHRRRFDRQTQNWAAAYAHGVLSDGLGRALVVSWAEQPVPYVSKGTQDRTLVVIDHRLGRFAAYDVQAHRSGEMFTGADSFYALIVSQLSEQDRARLGLSAAQAIGDLRHQVAQALVRNRAPDGTFYPYRREIAAYARSDDTSRIGAEPDALGLYALGSARYLFIEGDCFKVAQADPAQPWRIQHPSLNDAYAPALTHNGAGAWRHEWEDPLTWDGQRPFYRLGPLARALGPDAIEQVLRISGVTPDMLRRVHVRNELPPAVLLDTLERFTVHQRVKAGMDVGAAFFERMLGEVGADRADALVGRKDVAHSDQITVLEAKVALDKPQMEHLFFEALCPDRRHSNDPLAQVLQRDYPDLTNRVAEDLVRAVTPAERRSLESGVVPLTLTSAIRWWVQYLRKTRILESAHLPASADEDSATALLHALAQIDGWPAHLRVEVWQGGFMQTSVGPFDAALKCMVERVSHQYQAYLPQANGRRQPVGRPGPFLEVLLAALPLAERQSLGFTQGAGEGELLEQVRWRLQRIWEFAETQRRVGRRPHFHPPQRVADGRIAYPLSGRGLRPMERAQVARLRALYPARTDDEVLQLWRDAGDSVRERDGMIDYLYNEREAMNVALGQWLHGATGPAREARAQAVVRIQRCWAREASSHGTAMVKELNLDGLDLTDLPTLGAHFGHVEVLSLKRNQLSQLPTRFLRCFPGVTRLYLSDNRFEQMPPGLSEVPRLRALYLGNNRLKFRLGDVIRLSELTQLRVLDLSSNPLRQGQRLNLAGLKHLRYLNLRNTQLESLPKGAVTLKWLEVFDLANNRIQVLTRSDLFIYADVHRAMDLSGNPLSQGTLQMLRVYREQPGRSGIHFGLHPHDIPVTAGPDRWLAVLAVRDVPSHLALWQDLQGREIFARFFTLIERVAADPKFVAAGYRALREDLTGRVWRLIEGAANTPQLATILFEHPYDMSAGVNGCMVSLNNLELKFRMFELLTGGDGDGMPLLNCLRASSRLAAITNAVLLFEPHQTPELAGTRILAYRIALSAALDLPLGFDQRLDRTLGTPSPESVAAMLNGILAGETRLDWPGWLIEKTYWRQFLQAKYQVRLQATLGHYDQALEDALDRVNRAELSDGAYLALANDLSNRRSVDEDRLFLALTEGEWANFTGAADAAYTYQQ